MIRADSMAGFRIGEFTVEISADLLGKSGDLAAGAKLFSVSGSDLFEQPDFSFAVSVKEKGSSRNLLFQEDECSYPTRMYQLSCGEYECTFQNLADGGAQTYRIARDGKRILLTEDTVEDGGYMLFHRMGSLFHIILLSREACVFHGVVMEYRGMGILVMASAGTGKTTHTDMWERREGARIINGDRCLCRRLDGIWYAYGMPWAGSSGKIQNRKVRVCAVVMLERGQHNHVERLSGFEAELYLLQRIFAPVSRGTLQENAFQYAQDIAEKIPVFKLMCRPDEEAVEVLKGAVENLNKM